MANIAMAPLDARVEITSIRNRPGGGEPRTRVVVVSLGACGDIVIGALTHPEVTSITLDWTNGQTNTYRLLRQAV